MQKPMEIMLSRLIQQAKADHIDRFVVAGLIGKQNGQKVLCLKRASDDFMPGLYELPSGKVEENEGILTALIREIKEETNLHEIEITDYLSSFDYLSQSKRLTRQLNFIVKCDDIKTLSLSDKEHEGYSWVAAHEVDKYNISMETKKAIQGFFLRNNLAASPTISMIEAWNQGIERFVVGGVISLNNKVLLLKRSSDDFMGGIYELPSGKLEAGESIEMGIVREIKEETNLDVVALGKLLPHFDYRSGSGVLTRQINYVIQVDNTNNLKLSLEHEGFSWAHEIELNNYPISKEVKAVVENFLPKKPSADAQALADQGLFTKKRDRGDEPDSNVTDHKKFNSMENK